MLDKKRSLIFNCPIELISYIQCRTLILNNRDGRNLSLLAVDAIVIRGNGQKTDKFTITIGSCSSCLGNT